MDFMWSVEVPVVMYERDRLAGREDAPRLRRAACGGRAAPAPGSRGGLVLVPEGHGRALELYHGAALSDGEGRHLAEVVGREGAYALSDPFGLVVGAHGNRMRAIPLRPGDLVTLGPPPWRAVRDWTSGRLSWLVARRVEVPCDVERVPIEWHGLVSGSAPGHDSLFQLGRAAQTQAPVWVTGESGTGKELAAAAIHLAGPRRAGPYEALNCAALPSELVESELFGVERGAYTGATRTRTGAFARAHGGTLFLDEVGELPLAAQAKLLRVLETGEVRPVGADRVIRVDVRVVCASWRDLEHEVHARRFRHDLLHRLCVLRVTMPPLRARPEDVAPILHTLLEPGRDERIDEAQRSDGGDPLWPDEGVLTRLMRYSWPGNVRELKNCVARLLATHEPADLLPVASLSPGFAARPKGPDADAVATVLALNRGNRASSAKALGVSRSTFYRWLDRLGGRPAGRPSSKSPTRVARQGSLLS